jgi:uncharacterized protein YjdB
MTSFKRWFGAGAIVVVALVLIACPGLVPKVTNEIPDMQFSVADLAAGKAKTITLANHFDVDRDPQYDPKSADPAVATATEADGILTVTPIASGTTNVTVTASKGGNDPISQAFSVTVAEPEPPETPTPNYPPVIRTYIPDMSIEIGTAKMLTLSESYLDAESDSLNYTATSSDESVAMISGPDANSVITITAVAEGSATITVSASDREGLAIPQEFDVTVTPTPVERPEPPVPPDNNQPRQTRDIPGLTGTDALKFGGSQDVDLSEYFTDDDGDDVTYTADSTDPNVVTADVSGSTVTVTVVAPGMARIDVTATDPYNESVRGSFHVEVIDQAPMVQADEPTKFGPFMIGATQDILLSRYFSDPEGESLTYTAMSDMTDYVTVSAVGADSTITITAVAAGTAMITITADDGTNDAVSHMLTVTVVATPPPANNAPMVKPGVTAPAVELVVEGGSKTLTLSMYFMDADADDTLMYTVTSSDPSVATAIELAGVLTIMPEGAGTATINVTASDGEAMSEALDISVTVRAAANLTPTVTGDGLLDLKMVVGGVETIDLADFFDDDSPRLFYKVTSDDSAEATIELAGGVNDAGTMVDDTSAPNGTNFASMLHIEGKGAGTATVTVVATDIGNKSVTDEFMVDVIAADENDAPTASGTIDGMDASGSRLKVGESETVIDDASISTHFADPNLKNGTSRRDGELLTFEVRYFEAGTSATDAADSDTEQLAAEDQTVSHSLSAMTWDGTSDSKFTLTLTGVKASTDVVVVALVATDEYGVSVAKVFNVRVNHPPKAEGAQATPKTLSGETAYRSLTWDETGNGRPVVLVAADAGYFTDADNDDLTCSYVQSPEADDDAPADISLAGTTLTITPDKQTGTMSVEVTCSDMDSGSASDTLQIGVVGKTFSVR